MSKAVKSVGRAIGKVVKGVVKVVKKVASSKIGKILITAAAIYFGGAAIMGAMGGASAGTGFLGTLSGAVSGAGAGISSAWTGLTGAASAAMGGNFAAAGSSLGSGFTGAYGAGSSAVTGAAAAAPSVFAGGSVVPSATTVGAPNSVFAGGTLAPTSAASTASKGLVSGMWNGLGDYGKMAAVQGATQMAGGVIQGYGQQKAVEDQRNYEAEQAQLARDRYNQNAGTMWWGGDSGGGQAGGPVPVQAYASGPPTGLVQGAMTPQQKYAEDMRRRMATYDPYAMNA